MSVRTRSDLDKIIAEQEADVQNKEHEIARLRLALREALNASSAYEAIIKELEDETKSMSSTLHKYKEENTALKHTVEKLTRQVNSGDGKRKEESDTNMSSDTVDTLHELREQLKQEKATNKSLSDELSMMKSQSLRITPSDTKSAVRDTFKYIADTMCEELVQLDDDIDFLSSYIKPPEEDPYMSTKGRPGKGNKLSVKSIVADSPSIPHTFSAAPTSKVESNISLREAVEAQALSGTPTTPFQTSLKGARVTDVVSDVVDEEDCEWEDSQEYY